MPVIGIGITAIDAKKYEEVTGPVKVNSNTNIKEIKEQDLPVLNKKGLSVNFEFKTQYVNDKNKTLAEIVIGGDVFFIDNEQDKILKDWKKEKKLPDEVNLQIINTILRKGITKALNLSEELQLPPPIILPFAKKQQEESRYIG